MERGLGLEGGSYGDADIGDQRPDSTLNQITAWEQGRSRPLGGARAYLTLIDREPGTIITMLRPLREARQAA